MTGDPKGHLGDDPAFVETRTGGLRITGRGGTCDAAQAVYSVACLELVWRIL